MGFIFVTALLDVISLGIMIPVLPHLILEFVGGSDIADAARWTGIFATAWGVTQFFCSPILGMLSDRFGRRPVLLISIFGLGLDFLFMALAPSLAWLFVGRIISGATAANFSTASAYIADVTKPENRARSFGLIGAAFGVGFIIGPALGGLLGEIDIRLPFYVAAALCLLNWLYGFFVLPESLPVERRLKRFEWKRANPAGSFQLLRTHPELLGLAGVMLLFQLAHNVFPSIFVLYTGYRYGWDTQQIGLMMMVTGIATAIAQGVIIGPAVKKLGERGALLVGLSCAIGGFCIYGLAPTGAIFLLAIPVFCLSGLVAPGAQGLMSRRVQPWEQGQLQGANAGMTGIAAVIGPLIYAPIFAWTIENDASVHQPGLAILMAAGLLVIGLLLAARFATKGEDQGTTSAAVH